MTHRASGRPSARHRRPRTGRGRGGRCASRSATASSSTCNSTSTNRPDSSRGSSGAGGFNEPAGHHRPDLRHLPGRLPDERVPCARRCTRRHGRRPAARAPPVALLLVSGSRATPSTSTSSTPPTSSATTARWRWPAPTVPRFERGLGGQEDRQRDPRDHRRASDPPGEREGGRFLPGAHPPRARNRCANNSCGAAISPTRWSGGWPASTSPIRR